MFLLEKRAETAIVKSSTISNSRVLDSAINYPLPIKPKRMLIVLVGMILGIICGIAYAFLREFLNDTVKAIRTTIESNPAALYLINSNDTLSLYDIIQALKTRFKKEWKIQGNQVLCRNDIMIDERVQIVKLKEIDDLFMLK